MYLGVTLDRTLTYRRHLESLQKTDVTRRTRGHRFENNRCSFLMRFHFNNDSIIEM